MTVLSILIPTIIERKEQFLELTNELMFQRHSLKRQHPTLGWVEIITDNSPKFLDGGLSIGAKRQKLLEQAAGEYVCFMDDDDKVAPNYLETLVRLCAEGKDCVSFRTLIKNDHYWATINMSLSNRVDKEVNPNGIIERGIWHICPIKASIAKKFKFDSISHGEDVNWLTGVRKKLKSEAHIDIILTQYNHSEKRSEADKIYTNEFIGRGGEGKIAGFYPKGS